MKSIILAGGSGSRLWPLSRDLYPKQLLTLDANKSLLQQTFTRLHTLCKAREIVTITNINHFADVKLQLNEIDKANVVIGEPLGKNTAPAIACTLEYFLQCYKEDDVVLIVPSDHLIKNIASFQKTVEQGRKLAEEGYIVTFGIKPTYPETGYGYIKVKEQLNEGYKVERFVEKPNIEKAQSYLQSGDYYWNGGIFMGKISVFMEEFKTHTQEIYELVKKLDFSKEIKIQHKLYENMPSISVDYAVMEKSQRIALVELLSDWNDLGSWQSLYNIREKDEIGNVLTGKVVVENVKNSFIYSQKEVVAVSDLEDLILIETEDAIMACKMHESQNVKKLYERLKKEDSTTTRLHKTVFRPWGYYTCMNGGKGYLTKTICVMPQQMLSLQSHNHRSEHWVVLEGKAVVVKGEEEFVLLPGESIDIPIGTIHSLKNPYSEELKIIEVQKGDYLSEDDIIRYKDFYGRV
ncbi:MAG TPA: mannose-1-phosphate guanylyltransferase/mannose-6-phosphate isomerase [Porphyromonadaceae bacterium]|nr:mannose-1-phosphate guanylyltransferase/mannose-6-phosphate isomerase [Porphyromonadaceae bacterium]